MRSFWESNVIVLTFIHWDYSETVRHSEKSICHKAQITFVRTVFLHLQMRDLSRKGFAIQRTVFTFSMCVKSCFFLELKIYNLQTRVTVTLTYTAMQPLKMSPSNTQRQTHTYTHILLVPAHSFSLSHTWNTHSAIYYSFYVHTYSSWTSHVIRHAAHYPLLPFVPLHKFCRRSRGIICEKLET